MFTVGRTYEFRIIEGGDETVFAGTIERYEHPLIKLADIDMSAMSEPFRQPGIIKGQIINVTSANFISAVERA